MLIIRSYQPSDAAPTLVLFRDTVQKINAKDYTADQIGFADMASDGYLDRLYVSAAHQREGVGKRLVAALEQRVASSQDTAYVSITAQPFFKAMGYSTIREHRAFIGTTSFRNCLMGKKVRM